MKISPNITTWFGVITTVLLLIGSGTIALPLGIPHESLDTIKSWAAFIGAVSNLIMTGGVALSSAKSGPLAPPPSISEAKAITEQAVEAAKNK